MTTVEKIVELIRETSTSIPVDVEKAVKAALKKESKGSSAEVILKTILENCALARKASTPLCQDTGTLTFFVDTKLKRKVSVEIIKKAAAIATARGYLRKNCIDSITGKSYDDNCCEGAPVVHYVDKRGVTLIMKGGGSENMSRQYSLPDSTLSAGRDLQGVRKCLLDAVQKTLGYGCAPGILGVCIGGDRATGYEVAKEQLLRELSDKNPDKTLSELEKRVLSEANSLGIGPMGLGGATTLLGVKIASRPRVPASFFVTIAYMCWAARRRTIEV
ncbi:MAG: fumarate hydratase [Kiritimatiellae bacterium]|nr:fumarate hydratase [Kiritimatiellia bacterium]